MYQVSSDCEQSLTTFNFLDSLQYIVRPVHSNKKGEESSSDSMCLLEWRVII